MDRPLPFHVQLNLSQAATQKEDQKLVFKIT